jgi:hypothetical protein
VTSATTRVQRRLPRRAATSLAAVLLAGGTLAATIAVPAGQAIADTDPPLVLVEQPFTIDPNGTLELTTRLADTVDLDDIVANGTVIVTSHRPLSTRTQVWDARDGSLPNVVDTIDITPRTELAPGPSPAMPGDPVGAEAIVSEGGVLSIRVPTETTTRTADALQFAQPGIHPVVIEVRRGDTNDGVLITFIDRLTGTSQPADGPALGVGLVMAPPAAPTVADDGELSLDTSARAALGALADSLDAVPEALGTDDTGSIPALVDITPSALATLAGTDSTLASELTELLGRVDLVAAPHLPLDPSTAVAAGQALTYGRLLEDGIATLADTVDGAVPTRSTTIAHEPLSRGGAELLAATDTDTVVLTYDGYAALDGSLGLFTDTTLAVDIADVDLRAMIVDPYLAEQFSEPGPDTAAAAVAIVAEIVLIAEQIRRTDDLDGHMLLLGSTDLGAPDPELLRGVVGLFGDARQVRLVSPGDLVGTVETMLVDGSPVTVGLPDEVSAPDGYDPVTRAGLVDTLRADTTAVASMLPDDDQRRSRWATATDQLASTVVSDDLAAATTRTIGAELDQVRQCVVPPERFSFTLTGRTSTIPFQISNRCDVAVTVRVQLDSPKISFPDGEQLVELAPGADTEVRAKAVARTNGRSSIFLRLLTPETSGANQAVAPEVVLTARVRSLAGIGQLLLGTLVLVVLAWWLRHWRDARRQAALATNAQHHPAARSGR